MASDALRMSFTMASLRIHNKPNADKSNLAEQLAHLLPEDGNSSRLNPQFIEEMMGFPFGWTVYPFLSTSGGKKHSKPTATQ